LSSFDSGDLFLTVYAVQVDSEEVLLIEFRKSDMLRAWDSLEADKLRYTYSRSPRYADSIFNSEPDRFSMHHMPIKGRVLRHFFGLKLGLTLRKHMDKQLLPLRAAASEKEV